MNNYKSLALISMRIKYESKSYQQVINIIHSVMN